MKYCCTHSKRKKKKFLRGIFLIFLGVSVILICVDGYVRTIIKGYPMSVASGIILELMDEAMNNVMNDTKLDTKSVDRVVYGENNSVISVNTDIEALNKIKTNFSHEMGKLLDKYGSTLNISVPLGTLIGNEYTIGRGPEIFFKLRYSYSVKTNLKSDFTEAGINNTRHTISLEVSNEIMVIIPWGNNLKTVNTEYILAETVIVGTVPDAFTNVYDSEGNITDDIFNYRAE